MPDLARPVQTVKLAVDNLVKVSLSYSNTQYGSHRFYLQNKSQAGRVCTLQDVSYFVLGYQGDRSLYKVIYYILSKLVHYIIMPHISPRSKDQDNLSYYPSKCASKSSKLIKINFGFRNFFLTNYYKTLHIDLVHEYMIGRKVK